eukprot:1449843-Rhodomonas_salina.3
MDSPVESMMTEIHSHTLPYVAGGAETRGWGAEAEVGEGCFKARMGLMTPEIHWHSHTPQYVAGGAETRAWLAETVYPACYQRSRHRGQGMDGNRGGLWEKDFQFCTAGQKLQEAGTKCLCGGAYMPFLKDTQLDRSTCFCNRNSYPPTPIPTLVPRSQGMQTRGTSRASSFSLGTPLLTMTTALLHAWPP